MSGVKKIANKASKAALKLGGAVAGGFLGGPVGAVAGYKAGDVAGDKAFGRGDPAEVPGAPTLDNAQRQRDMADRLRKRRGVLANLYGSTAGNTSPTVGTKTLTGQ